MGAHIHVDLGLVDLAVGVHFVLELDGDFLLRIAVDHHVAQVIRQAGDDFLARHTLGNVLRHDLANEVGHVAAFGVVAKLGRDRAHQIAHKVHAVVALGVEQAVVHIGPARGLAGGGVLANQVGLPHHVGRLVRWHEDGVVKLEVACSRLDLLVEGVHFLDAGIGHMGDDVCVQLLERFFVAHADGGNLGLGVEDDDLARNLVFLDMPGNQAGSLVRRRRAAVRGRRQRHHQRAALEVLDLALEREHLLIGDIGVGKVGARVVNGALVVAKPGFVVVANAARQNQEVVFDQAVGGAHQFFVALKARDFGLQQRVAVLVGRVQHVAVHKIRAHDIDQPLVAHGAGPERGIALQQHHVGIGNQLAQIARSRHAAPAATANDDARTFAFARQDG